MEYQGKQFAPNQEMNESELLADADPGVKKKRGNDATQRNLKPALGPTGAAG